MINDLEQFSEERLQRYINQFAEDGMCDITDDEIMPLIRIALTAKQAKPIGIFNQMIFDVAGSAVVFSNKEAIKAGFCSENGELTRNHQMLYTTPQPAHTEQYDTHRMNWLVSQNVEVRIPMLYGSHARFVAQCDSDDCEEYHTTLREQIDAAMLAAAPKTESE